MKTEKLCDGKYCSKHEQCQLYINFVALAKAGKFPRSIDSMCCIEPIWQDEHFTKLCYSEFIKVKK